MQLQPIPSDVEAHQLVYAKWQQRTTELLSKREAHEKSVGDVRQLIADKETALRSVLENFSKEVTAATEPPPPPPPVPAPKVSGKGTGKGGASPAAGGPTTITPESEVANAKQRGVVVQGLTDLFNGVLPMGEDEGGASSSPQAARPTPKKSASPIRPPNSTEPTPNNENILREPQLKQMAGDGLFTKVQGLRDQRLQAEGQLSDAKVRMEKLMQLKTTLEKMQTVCQYGERAVLTELQRLGTTGRKLQQEGQPTAAAEQPPTKKK